ncbi:DUF4389 domain-containing protein [Smaragdicoccus niigatensis]|nr:DUF4389 domain-containing protein [Smaragdicoccus niigatensis]
MLIIPHLIILIFLGIAFFILTIVAGFAILFTGKYPRGIFDFNLGVLRWGWRVSFYSYYALGTDKYPPFTLNSADYPAELDIAYPEHLSRVKVLFKWWLLAIPHYLILGAMLGSGATFAMGVGDDEQGYGGQVGFSLLTLLVLVGAIILLFKEHFPKSIFDFAMGINRWMYRVVAYAALMTDEYPPFRLDMGPAEPPAAPSPAPAGDLG